MDKEILKALVEGTTERKIYIKGREDALKEEKSEMDSLIKWLQEKLLHFREINREYKDIYPERYIEAYEEVLKKIFKIS